MCILTVRKPGLLSLVSIMTSPPAPIYAPLSHFLAFSWKVSAPKVWFQDSKPQRHRNSGFQNVCFYNMYGLECMFWAQVSTCNWREGFKGYPVFLRNKWTSICRMSQNATNSDQYLPPPCKAESGYRTLFTLCVKNRYFGQVFIQKNVFFNCFIGNLRAKCTFILIDKNR